MQPICEVDHRPLADWLASIPFEDWPQQHRLNGELRPAMVTDLAWHGFGDVARPIVDRVMRDQPGRKTQQWMLSVVMPGHYIEPHRDQQPPHWLYRTHVPIVTNDQAWIIINGIPHRMEAGFAYEIDTRRIHSIVNNGKTPRAHFMFDVMQ